MRARADKTRFARLTRSIINALAVVLGLLVASSQIKDIRPDALLTTSSADIAWRAALVFYCSTIGHGLPVPSSRRIFESSRT